MNTPELSSTMGRTLKSVAGFSKSTGKLKTLTKKIIASQGYMSRIKKMFRLNELEIQHGYSEIKRPIYIPVIPPESLLWVFWDPLIMVLCFIHMNLITIW